MNDQSETRTSLPDAIERGEVAQSSERSHEELQAIYDGMLDGLLVADVHTKRLVGCNAAICRMLGYSADELLSLSVMEIHPRHELPKVLESFTAQAEGWLSIAEELPVLRKDGSVFYADVGARSIVYRQARRLIGMFRDVTERRRAREALERERRVLRDMLSAQDRERQLVAYDIHDGLAQQLAGAIMQFESYASHPRQRGARWPASRVSQKRPVHPTGTRARKRRLPDRPGGPGERASPQPKREGEPRGDRGRWPRSDLR